MLERFGVGVIGCDLASICMGEDRELFAAAMRDIGLSVPESGFAHSLDEAAGVAESLGYPVAIYSIVVTAKLNGLNQRAYLEWLLAEMPDDDRLSEPGRIDRYLPWSEDVPDSCRLTTGRADEGAVLPDEPIVDDKVLEGLPETS